MPAFLALWLLSSLVLLSCTPYRAGGREKTRVDLPKTYAGSEALQKTMQPPPRWWYSFGDPNLNRVMQSAIRDNLDLRSAWARLQQSRAVLSQATSARWPQLDAQLQGSRQKITTLFGSFQNSLYTASLAASYELDVFGRISASVKAAGLEALAAREDIEALAISLSAEVVEAWFDCVEAQARSELLEEQLRMNRTYLDLVTLRFQEGLVSAVDVHQQQQIVASIEGQLALATADTATRGNRLRLLLGDARAQVTPAQKQLPNLPAVPAVGVPSQLLRDRPDIRAARARVEAADHRIASAVAERFPALRLTGTLGVSSTSLRDLLESLIWSVIGNATAPLIDGGRRKAAVAQQRALLEERLADYLRVIVQAMLEVENALVLERQNQAALEALQREIASVDKSVEETRARYQEGLSDYLPVLSALQQKQQLEVRILSTQRQRLSYRVQLHRALGGSWTAALTPPRGKGKRGS